MLSKSKIVIVAMIIGSMTAASTIFSNVYAAPTTTINGRGTGTFTCADNTENPNLGLFISAHQGKIKGLQIDKLSGSWQLNSPDFSGQLFGEIYGGKISKTGYSLLATEFNNFGICPNDATPVKGTIMGQCGQGVKVQFNFENGAHGSIFKR